MGGIDLSFVDGTGKSGGRGGGGREKGLGKLGSNAS